MHWPEQQGRKWAQGGGCGLPTVTQQLSSSSPLVARPVLLRSPSIGFCPGGLGDALVAVGEACGARIWGPGKLGSVFECWHVTLHRCPGPWPQCLHWAASGAPSGCEQVLLLRAPRRDTSEPGSPFHLEEAPEAQTHSNPGHRFMQVFFLFYSFVSITYI